MLDDRLYAMDELQTTSRNDDQAHRRIVTFLRLDLDAADFQLMPIRLGYVVVDGIG